MDEIAFNILLLGDSSVGKTSLMLRFSKDLYEDNKVSTIGLALETKNIEINSQKITLNIYDTSGQERYHSLAKSYLRKVDGIIFVFDLTSEKSFDNIIKWLTTCEDIIQDFQKIIVGNKMDLENREIDIERAENFSKKYKMKFFQTSAKNDINVERIFNEIAKLILESKQKIKKIEVNEIDKEKEDEKSQKNIKLTNKKKKSKKKKKFC